MIRNQKHNIYTNSFFLPNEIFDYKLTSKAFYVYAYLHKCSNKQHQCWPTRTNIAKNCNIKSLVTVDVALNELIDAGLIDKMPVYSFDGKSRQASVYTLSII